MFNLSWGEVSSLECSSEGYEVTALNEMSLSSAFFVKTNLKWYFKCYYQSRLVGSLCLTLHSNGANVTLYELISPSIFNFKFVYNLKSLNYYKIYES